MIHWCVWDATGLRPTREMMQSRWTEQGRRVSYPYWNHGQPFGLLCNKLCGSWVLAIQLRLSSRLYPLSWNSLDSDVSGGSVDDGSERGQNESDTVRDKEDLNQHKRIGNRMRGCPGSQKVQRSSREVGRRTQHSRVLSSYSKGTLTVSSTPSSSPT